MYSSPVVLAEDCVVVNPLTRQEVAPIIRRAVLAEDYIVVNPLTRQGAEDPPSPSRHRRRYLDYPLSPSGGSGNAIMVHDPIRPICPIRPPPKC